MNDDFKRKMREIESRIVQSFDQEIMEFRDFYHALNDDDRSEFRNWITELNDVVSKQPDIGSLRIRALLDNSITDENGTDVYVGGARLSPAVMFDAVSAWDDGAEFTPKLGGICK